MSDNCKCGCGHDHEHEHEECGCGCGCGDEQAGIITLVDEDGIEHEFEIIDQLEEGDDTYIALVECYEDDADVDLDDPGDLLVLKVVAEGFEEYLEAIEDEEEFDRVSAIFMERLSSEFDFVEE